MSALAQRYASKEMRALWSINTKILAERKLWISLMKFQSTILDIPDSAINDYQRVLENIDLESIDNRERELRHDVKARIDEFNALAGHQYIHLGMTSRDLTENIEAFQIRQSLLLIRDRSVALLAQLAHHSSRYSDLAIVGRSHNVPAQVTTLGKKFATIAQEALFAFARLENLIDRLALRGIKGPVGTAQDSLDLVGDHHLALEAEIARELGFTTILDSTGQIYPRSFDLDLISALTQLAAAPSNLATSIRLMAGHQLVSEGFAAGQVGSSAMPHKMNSRSCERINGLSIVLRGYLSMISEISGDQWNEGDVSDSVVRRVALADSFYAIDGIIETTLTVLREFTVFPEMIKKELARELPFLATTKILMAAVKAGMGRERAHHLLQELTTKAALDIRAGHEVDLIALIAQSPEIPLDRENLEQLLAHPSEFTGHAAAQIEAVVAKVSEIIAAYPKAAEYRGGDIR
jgi:adenylosuccinate lyase